MGRRRKRKVTEIKIRRPVWHRWVYGSDPVPHTWEDFERLYGSNGEGSTPVPREQLELFEDVDREEKIR